MAEKRPNVPVPVQEDLVSVENFHAYQPSESDPGAPGLEPAAVRELRALVALSTQGPVEEEIVHADGDICDQCPPGYQVRQPISISHIE